MRTRAVITFATATAVAVWMGLAGPVFASSAGRAAGTARGAPASPSGRSTIPTVKSATFAGYSIQGGGEATFKVAAHIVVPKLKCTSAPERAIAPSVGVYNMTNSFSAASVFVGCQNGHAHYFLSLVVNGTNHNYTTLVPRAGDTVALRVSQAASSTVVSAVDKTHTAVKKTLTGAGSKSGGGPWVGDSSWNNPGELGVPNFGKLHFSGSTLNGTSFGSAGGSALVRYNRVNGSTSQITTGALVNQKSFTTVFKHS